MEEGTAGRAPARGAFIGLAAAGAALAALCPPMLGLLVAARYESFVFAALVQSAIYAFAVWLVLRHRFDRRALLVIFLVAVVARAVALPAPATLSTDVSRYVWDGRVQAAGINPYRYVPADEHLKSLRDQAIYPNINRAEYAPTIYPPVAQMIFLGVTRLSETLTAMRLAMIGFEIVTVLALLALLRHDRAPLERVLIYAWHPLPIWEFAGTGHVDAAAIAFMTLAMLAVVRDRRVLAGLALAAGVLVKPFALIIAPVLWRRWDWRVPAAFAAALVVCYLPYLSVGTGVLGYLDGYGDEQGYIEGSGFFVVAALRALGLPAPGGPAFAALRSWCWARLHLRPSPGSARRTTIRRSISRSPPASLC